MEKNYFDNNSITGVIKKYKWHILVITIIGAIAGAVFSGERFITPKYRSSAVIYPYNLSTYSDENETEQMLQFLNSQSIIDSTTVKENLYDHYKISQNYQFKKTALIREWSTNVKISRTPYDAVSIKVSDKDPQMAYNIVNDIIDFYNKRMNATNKQRCRENLRMYGTQLKIKEESIDSLRARLSEISSEYGVVDYEAQSREVTRWFLSGGGKKGDEMKKNLEQYGPEIVKIKTMIEEETAIYSLEKKKYDEQMCLYSTELTFYEMINEPFVSDRKSYPVRWVIVALVALGAMFMSVLTLLVIERNRKRE